MGPLNDLLSPLYYVVSWILVTFHALWSTVLPEGSGAAWTLSIVGLVVVIRILLIPLFVKQIKAQRALQILQPEIKAVQKRFKDDRQKQSEELMKLYRENGTNPFSSCLPILLQMPIFFALFHVLSYGVQKETPIPPMTQALVESAHDATLLGAPISATFIGTDETRVKVVSLVLIILMSLTTFITQRQLLVKGVANADSNPFLKQQRILVYVFPVMFAVFGINFPIGVLVYWLTTNLWSMGQQFYVIRNNPAPGSQAYEERQKRLAEKAAHEAAHSGSAAPTIVDGQPKEPPKPARNQPKRKPRSQRRGPAGGSLPSGSGTGQSGTGEPSSGEPGKEEQA